MKRLLSILFLALSLMVQGQSGFAGLRSPFVDTATSLRTRLQPMAGTLKLERNGVSWERDQVLESSFFRDSDGTIKLYYSGSSDAVSASFDNRIGLVTAPSMEAVWVRHPSNPLIGQGAGGAPTNRRAHSPWVGKLGSTYYAFATNGYGYYYAGEDRQVYLYSSSDGVSWSDGGAVFTLDGGAAFGITGYGNTSIVVNPQGTPVQVGGKYQALIEAWGGAFWELYHAEATSFTGPWTITQKAPSLQVGGVGMYGGAWTVYDNSTYHVFYHYGASAGNLPTLLAYATSADCKTFTVREAPFKAIEAEPFDNTDQIADPCVVQIGGYTYMTAEYVQNTPFYRAEIRMWRYPGTFAQLVSGLSD